MATRRAVLPVLWSRGVDHQAVEHGLHLAFDLVQQAVQLARLDELGDVVVGVEALPGGADALANLDRDGCALVLVRGVQRGGGVNAAHEAVMVAAAACGRHTIIFIAARAYWTCAVS